LENSEKRDSTGQKLTANKEKQSKDNGEQKEGSQEKEEKECETISNPSNNSTSSGICKPKKADTLRVVILDPEIQAYREHMAEHAVICKFMGLWPTERALCQWIRQQWKPKGDVKLHLGAKGFFTVVFTNLEDKDRIFYGGPYFLASAGLYMRPWKPNFVPEKETFTQVPVWIRLFSLPIDYWGLSALKQIGDQLGKFIKASEATMQRRYTSCARICVEMDVSRALHDGLWLEYRDEDYFQAIDYEQIPFRYQKCHEHGHLVRECPLNNKAEETKTEQAGKGKDNFIKPKIRQRANQRRANRIETEQGNHSNTFELLELDTNSEELNKVPTTSEGFTEKAEHIIKEGEEALLGKEIQMQEQIEGPEEDADMLTSDGGSEELELDEVLEQEGMNLPVMAENWKARGIENVPEEEIRKINDLFIARQKAELEKQSRKLGIAKGARSHSKSLLCNSTSSKQRRKRGRKTSGEALQELGIIMINLGKMKALNAFPSYH